MENISAKRDSVKRTLDSPNVPVKRLKQAKLPFKLIVSPRNSPIANVKPKAEKLNQLDKSPSVVLEKIDHVLSNETTVNVNSVMRVMQKADCKENKNPFDNKRQPDAICNTSKGRETGGRIPQPLIIDLTEGVDDEEPLGENKMELTVQVDQDICSGERGQSEHEEDEEVSALTPDISLEIDEGSIEVTEEQKIVVQMAVSPNVELGTSSPVEPELKLVEDKQEETSPLLSTTPPANEKNTSENVARRSQAAILRQQQKEEDKKKKLLEKAELLLKKQREREEKKQEEEKKKWEKKQEDEKRRLEKKLEEEKKKLEKKQEEERKLQEKKQLVEELKRLKQEIIDEKTKARQEKKQQREILLKEKEAEKERVEQINKKQEDKVKAVFANFFVKKDASAAAIVEEPVGLLQSFQNKDDMRLAPLHRNKTANSVHLIDNLDKWMQQQGAAPSYLDELVKGQLIPRKCLSTWPCDDVDVKIIDNCRWNHQRKLLKRKYFKFSENVRPPYSGTWQKRSTVIRPRHPLGKDGKLLNYDIDSDDEWEEEPGESLSQSEDENESDDNYEVDNDLFVPHGYLSDGEGDGDENNETTSPETLKMKLKLKEMEFEKEMKKKCLPIRPTIIGCIWMANYCSGVSKLDDFAAVILTVAPIDTRYTLKSMDSYYSPNMKTPTKRTSTGSAKSNPNNSAMLSDVEIPWFIKLVHGNQYKQQIIYQEFQEFWSRGVLQVENSGIEPNQTYCPRKSVLQRTLKHIASWGKLHQPGPMYNEKAWWVKNDILIKYNLENIGLPNKWNYHIKLETTHSSSPVVTKPGIAVISNLICTQTNEGS